MWGSRTVPKREVCGERIKGFKKNHSQIPLTSFSVTVMKELCDQFMRELVGVTLAVCEQRETKRRDKKIDSGGVGGLTGGNANWSKEQEKDGNQVQKEGQNKRKWAEEGEEAQKKQKQKFEPIIAKQTNPSLPMPTSRALSVHFNLPSSPPSLSIAPETPTTPPYITNSINSLLSINHGIYANTTNPSTSTNDKPTNTPSNTSNPPSPNSNVNSNSMTQMKQMKFKLNNTKDTTNNPKEETSVSEIMEQTHRLWRTITPQGQHLPSSPPPLYFLSLSLSLSLSLCVSLAGGW
jgi:hypothetical protein